VICALIPKVKQSDKVIKRVNFMVIHFQLNSICYYFSVLKLYAVKLKLK